MNHIISRTINIMLPPLASLFLCHCTGFESLDTGEIASSSSSSSTIDLKEKQPGIVKQSQILPSYSSCLGLPTSSFSQTTKTSYQELKTNLSDDGKSKTVSGPLLMAITQLAGDVCNDFVEYEKTNGSNFFKSFDLTRQMVDGAPAYESTMQQFANSCWGRSIYDEEMEYIIKEIAKTNLANNKGSAAAYFLCTTMLASPEVVIY